MNKLPAGLAVLQSPPCRLMHRLARHTTAHLTHTGSADTTVIAERVDEFLTVLLDADDRHLVGFRLKGFGYVFKTHIQPAMKLKPQHFDPIIYALTRFFTDVGNSLSADDSKKPEKREEAYKQVVELAQRDQVALPPDFALAA